MSRAAPPTSATTLAATLSVASPAPETPSLYALGRFPEFPVKSLSESSAALQGVLDAAVENGTFAGITASVIVADQGSCAGASGSAGGVPLTTDARRPTHSSAKTIVAAEVLRLAEEGRLGLDDQASDYLSPQLAFWDANGATIRQVLRIHHGPPPVRGAPRRCARPARPRGNRLHGR